MKYDRYGQAYTTEAELCELLYRNPTIDFSRFQVDAPEQYNQAVESTYSDIGQLQKYLPIDYREEVPVELFDHVQQQQWHMPAEYREFDIAKHVLGLCQSDAELQRVATELLLYQERNLFDLLRYLRYFVDTMRANGIVWGLGRGSSTASYVLYLLGVHKINSLYYDLPIEEFLK
jgi:DNA polymerase III alpha subunit